MTLFSGLYTYLQSKSAVTAIVGTRIFPRRVPIGSQYPAIAVDTLSNQRIYSHGGDNQLCYARLTLSCFANTWTDAANLSEQIRLAVSGYRGTWGTVAIQSCFVVDTRDAFDASPSAEPLDLFNVQVDLRIGFTEAAPTL